MLEACEVLGVTPDAGPSEWKRAYRRLAMRWHPDRNDHPEATERFKQINAAYELLTAVDVQETQENKAETDTAEAAETVVRAADIRLNLHISLEDAAHGCRKTLIYRRGKVCGTCAGSGEAGMSRTRFCPACHGSGRIRDVQRILIPCEACGGRGFFTECICPDCSGSGRDTADVNLEITIPPGMLSGDELRLAGQGELGDDERAAGDLYLTIVLTTHALYRLEGRDLHYRMPVGVLALLAGGEIELPSLGGIICHTLAEGSCEAREIRLAGKGYTGRGNRPAGDLIVTLEPEFPSNLSARQRKLLRQVHADMLDARADCLPAVDAWWRLNVTD
jgi:molecular chaperone DnaJ